MTTDDKCSNCSKPRAAGRTKCHACLAVNRAAVARWRVKVRAAGHCDQCGRPKPDLAAGSRCPRCSGRRAARPPAPQAPGQ